MQTSQIYTKNPNDIATFSGGPLIAGYLLSQNFKTFGQIESAKKSIQYSLLWFVLVIFGSILLPESVKRTLIPIFYLLPIVLADMVIKMHQGSKIEEFLKLGYKTSSSLVLFGKSLLSLIVSLIFALTMSLASNYFYMKTNYLGSLNYYCSSTFSERSLSKDNVYIPEDAKCYVYKHLKESGYTLAQINHVLNLEYEYYKKIGLADKSKESSNTTDKVNPFNFIKNNQTLGLSDNQIIEIGKTEVKYLQAIGLVE